MKRCPLRCLRQEAGGRRGVRLCSNTGACVCRVALTAHLSAPAAASGAYVWGTQLRLGAIELACIAAGCSCSAGRDWVCCVAACLMGRKAVVLRAVDVVVYYWLRLQAAESRMGHELGFLDPGSDHLCASARTAPQPLPAPTMHMYGFKYTHGVLDHPPSGKTVHAADHPHTVSPLKSSFHTPSRSMHLVHPRP